MSLRLRILLAFLLIVIVTLASVSISVRLSAANQVAVIRARGGWIGAEELIADLQAYHAAHGGWQGVEALLQTQGRGMGQSGQGVQAMGNRPGVRLADEQGVIVYDPANHAGEQLNDVALQQGITLKENGKVIGYLLPLQGQVFPGGEFDVQLLAAVQRASLYAALIAGGLALVLAFLLAYLLLRPVQQLTEAAKGMTAGDLSRRVEPQGGGELKTLGSAFNQMADSLQAAEQHRRAMTADIAHELRTPLSVQRANLEAMLDGVYPLDTQNLEKVLDQNTLLTRLVDDLRTLTLADAGELQLEKTPVLLNELVARLAARFQAQADWKEIGINISLPGEEISVYADPQRLEQILNNLLHNALRHTPPGGRVVIGLGRERSRVSISVHDSGAGIPQDALASVFERFYRADRGRAREDGGSGLGLSIARKLAEAHGGSLAAENHPEGGAVFTLSLPVQENPTLSQPTR